ncbi:MAG: DUF4160 domain-containing protein [Terrimonas sp.]|nr:DUF4160 domain-containing protein [Terrimonas sp.]
MPTVYRLNGIKIDVYSRDHLPPHFQAIYGGDEVLLVIKTLKIYAGSLPTKQLNQVQKWAGNSKTKVFLMNNFYRLNPYLRK